MTDPAKTPSICIEQLAERPDYLPIVAAWLYNEWWTEVPGADLDSLIGLLRAHLVRDQIPLTLVASLKRRAVGTATLVAHDLGTEQWPEFSPWLAAVYVAPEHRHCGVGTALLNAAVAKAAVLGVPTLYLLTVGQEEFYARLGWQVVDSSVEKSVMSKRAEN